MKMLSLIDRALEACARAQTADRNEYALLSGQALEGGGPATARAAFSSSKLKGEKERKMSRLGR